MKDLRLLGCEVDLVNSRNVLPIFKESIDKEGIALWGLNSNY